MKLDDLKHLPVNPKPVDGDYLYEPFESAIIINGDSYGKELVFVAGIFKKDEYTALMTDKRLHNREDKGWLISNPERIPLEKIAHYETQKRV